jgi:GGDEF domain-containing protein
MPSFELREVEFRSDGLTDSLTQTMSPILFHEALKREIASAKRDERDLAVLTLSLRTEAFKTASQFQEALIEIAFALRMGLRGGDFFARISDNGFWVLLRTEELNVQMIVKRLDLPHHDDLQSYIVARKYAGYDEWIEKIDLIHFN